MAGSIRVVLETFGKRSFASAIDWPGWVRSARTEEAAVDVLLDYAERYAVVAQLAGVAFEELGNVDIIDRQPGSKTTEFGAPLVVHAIEREPMGDGECERQLALLQATWQLFGHVSQQVSPEMKKGPRGGGRDRDPIIAHVVEADRGYARKIGVLTPPFDPLDKDAAAAHHESVFAAIPALRDGTTHDEKDWPVRYAIRRMAWHVIDYAWEMQDKSLS